MTRRVSAIDARKRLGQLLEEVFYRHDEIVVERAGKPMAAIVPVEELERLQRSKEHAFQAIRDAWARVPHYPEAEVERDVAAAISEVRRGKARRRP